MPPKKEVKEKQIKGDEAEDLVLQYLKAVNRPYASTDVSANLKNKVSKVAAQKILQALADKGELSVKVYGKQSMFVYNQDSLAVLSPDEMSATDQQVAEVTEELKAQREALKALERDLATMSELPKTKQLPFDIQRINEENALTSAALAPYRGTDDDRPAVQPLTKEQIKIIDADFTKWRKEWTSRKSVYKNLVDEMKNISTFKADEFEEDQGITPDDEEAIEVEQGEFCCPPVRPISAKPNFTKKPQAASKITTSVKTITTVAPVSPVASKKRLASAAALTDSQSMSQSDAPSQSSEAPKKRGKKA